MVRRSIISFVTSSFLTSLHLLYSTVLYILTSNSWIHPASGRVYSYSYKPPKVAGFDDETGEPLVQRDDDKPESVRKRLAAYDEVTSPLVEFYREQNVLKSFQGTMSDVIYPDVKAWLEENA